MTASSQVYIPTADTHLLGDIRVCEEDGTSSLLKRAILVTFNSQAEFVAAMTCGVVRIWPETQQPSDVKP